MNLKELAYLAIIAGLVVLGYRMIADAWIDPRVPQPISISKAKLNRLGRLIEMEGYPCPRLKDIAECVVQPEGRLLRLWCGPADDDDTLSGHMVYGVEISDHYEMVKKWGGDPETCY